MRGLLANLVVGHGADIIGVNISATAEHFKIK